MKRLALLCLTFAAATAPLSAQDLFTRVVTRIGKTPNTGVGVYYRRLDRPDSLLVDAAHRFHAASTMKVPVMIQVFRDADAGTLRLSDSLTVVNEFHSIVDGSPFQLDKADDSDSSLYLRVGQKVAVRDLLELMITVSSNLATDILIERVGAPRANATAHSLGADSILVLRGVEDGVAYRAGRNNTTTARRRPSRAIRCSRFSAASISRRGSPQGCRRARASITRRGGWGRWSTTTPPTSSCPLQVAAATCSSSRRAGFRKTRRRIISWRTCRG